MRPTLAIAAISAAGEPLALVPMVPAPILTATTHNIRPGVVSIVNVKEIARLSRPFTIPAGQLPQAAMMAGDGVMPPAAMQRGNWRCDIAARIHIIAAYVHGPAQNKRPRPDCSGSVSGSEICSSGNHCQRRSAEIFRAIKPNNTDTTIT